MMKLQPVAIAALLFAAAHALAEPARLHTLVPGALRVGTYFVNPPFEFLSNGERVGFEVDLIGEVSRRLELRPYFVNTHWQVILRQMQAGDYDCIVGGITITPARRQILRWSAPYMTTTLSLVVDSVRTPGIHKLADLARGTVGVQAATTDYDAAVAMQHRGRIKGVKVYPFDGIGRADRSCRGSYHCRHEDLPSRRVASAAHSRPAHRRPSARRSAASWDRFQQKQSRPRHCRRQRLGRDPARRHL